MVKMNDFNDRRDRPLHLYGSFESNEAALVVAKEVAVRFNVKTVAKGQDVYLVEPHPGFNDLYFREAWEEGQQLQGLWNEEEVASFRECQDPEDCFALWQQELEAERESERRFMGRYSYFNGD
jgi:hypothetical protein